MNLRNYINNTHNDNLTPRILSHLKSNILLSHTNFISSIPYLGPILIKWIWGNYGINNILINWFFYLHFITSLIVIILILLHLSILHFHKSLNPLGLNLNFDLINLNPIFISKDFIMMIIFYITFINFNLINLWYFNNSDNFNPINYFKTPNHIELEWYFIFFYSILRSIKNKFSGLIIIILIIILLTFLSLFILLNFNHLLITP